MLERILHFEEVPTSAGTAACVGVGAPLPRWRSTWPLSGAEQASGVASGSSIVGGMHFPAYVLGTGKVVLPRRIRVAAATSCAAAQANTTMPCSC